MASSPTDPKTNIALAYNSLTSIYPAWTQRNTSSSNSSSQISHRVIWLAKLLPHLPPTSHVLELGSGTGEPVTRLLAEHCYAGRVVGVDISEGMVGVARENLQHWTMTATATATAAAAAVETVGMRQRDGEGKDDEGCRRENGEEEEDEGGRNEEENEQKDVNERRLAEVEFIQGDMSSFPWETATENGARFDAVVAMYSIIHLPTDEQRALIAGLAETVDRESNGVGEGEERKMYLLMNFGAEADEGSAVEGWLGSKQGKVFWSSLGAEGSLRMLEENGFELIDWEVVGEDEDGREVRFLWVLASRQSRVGGEMRVK